MAEEPHGGRGRMVLGGLGWVRPGRVWWGGRRIQCRTRWLGWQKDGRRIQCRMGGRMR